MSVIVKKMLILFVALLLLVTGYFGVKLGMASINQYFLQAYTDSWSRSGNNPTLGQWQKAQAFFAQGSYWYASSPDLLQLGGDLYLWKASLEKTGFARNKALRHALTLYTSSLRQRPAYVYAWLSYAITKNKLGQRDVQFATAMRKVDELGKYEPAVLTAAVQIYFSYLSALEDQERKRLQRQINRLARVDPDSLVKVVKRYNLGFYLCLRVKGIQEVDDFCKRG